MAIIWIGDTSVGISETFVTHTLRDLSRIAPLKVIGGRRELSISLNAEVVGYGFAEPKEQLLERVMRKIAKRNFYYKRVDWNFGRNYSSIISQSQEDIIYVEFAHTAVMVADSLLQLPNKYIIGIHGMDISAMLQIEDYRERLRRVANAPNCRAVLCASEHTRRLAILAGILPEKCIVSRYALDDAEIRRDKAIGKTKFPSFVHLGRLTEKKHPIATLEAFRIVRDHHPEATIAFIGEGPLRTELVQRIAKLGLEGSVELYGAMSHNLALKKVQEFWVFVQHSVTSMRGDQEGFALSPAEAALLELPVVSTYHNGIPEHVIHGKTGFLVREFDFESMAQYMMTLVENRDLVESFGKAGRANIKHLCQRERRLNDLSSLIAGRII